MESLSWPPLSGATEGTGPCPLRAQADRCPACELSTLFRLPGDGVGDVRGRRQAQGARVIGWTSLC